MKPNIGIDFDDTMIDTTSSILDTLGLFFNEVYNIESIHIYDISESLCMDVGVVNDAIDVALTNEEFLLIKDVGKVIKWLSQFYNLYVVTSRPEEYIEYAEAILERSGVLNYITDVVSSQDKVITYNKTGIDTVIEDRGSHIVSAYRNDIMSLVYDRPWNRKITNTSLTQRVHTWQDIKDYFIIKLGE